jgi:hypothetical protein
VNVPRITDHGSALQISSFTLEKLVLKLASEINAEISTFSSIHNEKLSKVISVIRHLLLHRDIDALQGTATLNC